jgi:hypothetical protein
MTSNIEPIRRPDGAPMTARDKHSHCKAATCGHVLRNHGRKSRLNK